MNANGNPPALKKELYMRMICQICDEFVGEVSIEGVRDIAPLRYPFRGSMVGSPDPYHGFPAPFDPSLDWEFMRCPYGRTHRPFIQDDIVKTNKGMIRLPKDGSLSYLDSISADEIDRDSIPDRVIQISEVEAGRVVKQQRQTSEDFPFICLVCGKAFDKKMRLVGHMMSHSPRKRKK